MLLIKQYLHLYIYKSVDSQAREGPGGGMRSTAGIRIALQEGPKWGVGKLKIRIRIILI